MTKNFHRNLFFYFLKLLYLAVFRSRNVFHINENIINFKIMGSNWWSCFWVKMSRDLFLMVSEYVVVMRWYILKMLRLVFRLNPWSFPVWFDHLWIIAVKPSVWSFLINWIQKLDSGLKVATISSVTITFISSKIIQISLFNLYAGINKKKHNF